MLVRLAVEEGLKLGEFELAQAVSEVIEVLAIAIISISVVAAVVTSVVVWLRGSREQAFDKFKEHIARGLLIGLDLLIAADIIKTVTLEATLENAAVLGLLVIIRTFLSWTLFLEVEERWPWQHPTEPAGRPAGPPPTSGTV
jgi:uncharacterized membrane protein